MGCYGQMAYFLIASTPLSLSFFKENGKKKKKEEKVKDKETKKRKGKRFAQYAHIIAKNSQV